MLQAGQRLYQLVERGNAKLRLSGIADPRHDDIVADAFTARQQRLMPLRFASYSGQCMSVVMKKKLIPISNAAGIIRQSSVLPRQNGLTRRPLPSDSRS